jgi:ribose 5-phosphate isomerase A
MAVDRIAERISEGYRLTLVSTSKATEAYAAGKGLAIADIDSIDAIDVTFDGADWVDPHLRMVKGYGGALLKEKIVASMTEKEIIVVDDYKLIDGFGGKRIPVEVCRFASSATARALSKIADSVEIRKDGDSPFVTDEGHMIFDCTFGSVEDPAYLDSRIKAIPGVVETGIFVDLAHSVFAYSPDGGISEYNIYDKRRRAVRECGHDEECRGYSGRRYRAEDGIRRPKAVPRGRREADHRVHPGELREEPFRDRRPHRLQPGMDRPLQRPGGEVRPRQGQMGGPRRKDLP